MYCTSWRILVMCVMTIWVCHIRSAIDCLMRPVRTAWSCSLCFRSSATSWMDSSLSVGLHVVRLWYMISPLKALSLHSYRKPYSLNTMIPYCNLQYPVYFLRQWFGFIIFGILYLFCHCRNWTNGSCDTES